MKFKFVRLLIALKGFMRVELRCVDMRIEREIIERVREREREKA